MSNLELFDLADNFEGRCIVKNMDSSIVVSHYMDRYGKLGKSYHDIDFYYFNMRAVLDSIITYKIRNGYKDETMQHKIDYVAIYKKIPYVLDISYYNKFSDFERNILYMFLTKFIPSTYFKQTLIYNNLDTTGYWEYYEDTKKYEFEEWSE